MDSALWLPLVGTLIGALAALGGGVLTPRAGARHAHEQWLRDKRAELCERYYSALQEAISHIARGKMLDVYMAGDAQSQHALDRDMDKAFDINGRLRDAASALSLYASHALSQASEDLASTFLQADIAGYFPDKAKERAHFEERFTAGAGEVQSLIRRELKVDDGRKAPSP